MLTSWSSYSFIHWPIARMALQQNPTQEVNAHDGCPMLFFADTDWTPWQQAQLKSSFKTDLGTGVKQLVEGSHMWRMFDKVVNDINADTSANVD